MNQEHLTLQLCPLCLCGHPQYHGYHVLHSYLVKWYSAKAIWPGRKIQALNSYQLCDWANNIYLFNQYFLSTYYVPRPQIIVIAYYVLESKEELYMPHLTLTHTAAL